MRAASFLLACIAVSGIVTACGHDDFPDRLRTGCNSAAECTRLVAEASDRLNDCAGYMVGNSMRRNWRRAKTMCHYELVDCDVALEKANQWVRWANATGVAGPGKQLSYYRYRWKRE
ncbi:MAG TPA: hypothetical protein VH062_04125 [Polyangiaceae bacterium]|nr:hypothetical protein [Polyangiaceae bacterium]